MKTWKLVLWIVVHMLLGKIGHVYPIIPTVHAYAVFGLGCFWAIRGNSVNLIYTAAYIVGAEVFWRMTEARIFWEFGKYAIGFIFLIHLIMRGWKKPFLPLLYFSLLLPSTIFLPLLITNVDRVNYGDISFNLSGPFCLMVCALFFSKTILTRTHLVKLFFYLTFPIFSVLAIARGATFDNKSLEGVVFQSASNLTTSGGFGPNQVSSMLALAALLYFLVLISQRTGFIQKIIIFIGIGAFAAQSALTFSRSGLYFAVISGLFGLSFFLRNRKNFSRFIFTFALLGIVGGTYVWPQLISFTGGAVEKRFHDTKLTHREEIWRDDLLLFQKNPILGVGPGQSKRKRTNQEIAGVVGHIEPSRMLSEHGIFGLFSFVVLILMMYRVVFIRRDPIAKGYAISFVVWGGAFICINGMRIAAPSFFMGLASAVILTDIAGLFKNIPPSGEAGSKSEKPPTLKDHA